MKEVMLPTVYETLNDIHHEMSIEDINEMIQYLTAMKNRKEESSGFSLPA